MIDSEADIVWLVVDIELCVLLGDIDNEADCDCVGGVVEVADCVCETEDVTVPVRVVVSVGLWLRLGVNAELVDTDCVGEEVTVAA